MAIPIEELTSTHYDILAFANKTKTVSFSQFEAKFNKVEALGEYISDLATPNRVQFADYSLPLQQSRYLCEEHGEIHEVLEFGLPSVRHVGKGVYSITDIGRKALQDFQLERRLANKKLFKEKVVLPIVVSIATTIILNLLLWLTLWITGWLTILL